jgi:aminobenzoyl-glutamate transport protein
MRRNVWALLITMVLSALLAPIAFQEDDPRTGNKYKEYSAPVAIKKDGKTVTFRREDLALLGTIGTDPFPAGVPWQLAAMTVEKEPRQNIKVKNMLAADSLVLFLTSMVTNFTGFAPLGVVLVALLGVGVAEHAGLINAGLKGLLNVTPKKLLTPMVILVGLISHSAGDSGYVVVVPLAGVMFYAAGRHPLAGITAGFAAVSGGFSANLIPSPLDPLLQGFTQQSAQLLDPARTVNPLCNYYFMICSSFLIIGVGWFITDRIIEPRLLRGSPVDGDVSDMPKMEPLTDLERRGLFAALWSILIFVVLMVAACYPAGSPLRDAAGSLTSHQAPLMASMVPMIAIIFLLPGLAYGYVAGSIKSHRDVIKGMSKSMSTMGYYLVLAFFAAQFTYAFTQSNLGALLAVYGAKFLAWLGVPGPVLIIGIILLSTMVNLLIGSASAKWALLGPIFVPMLMTLGYSPELTQAAYRIGDSSTNIITPLMPYFPLVVMFAQKYVRSTGIGTLITLMIYYSMSHLLIWTLFLLFYWQVLGAPLGLQAPYTYTVPG